MDQSRRDLLTLLGGTGMALAIGRAGTVRAADPPQGPRPGAPKEGEVKIPAGTMPMRTLGRTGVKVSLLGLGGYHIGIPKDEKEGIRIIHAAMDHGVNFLDNCWDYHKGKSEERMGKALEGARRQKAFLMTKLDGRTRDPAMKQLEQSLKRLKTDVIDLVQIHEVIRKSDAERTLAAGGAIEALVAAQKAGKLRYIGFTGHKDPDIHLHMLAAATSHGFTFDAVQLPLNVMDAHFRSFEKKVLPALRKQDIGVLGMKPLGGGIMLDAKVASAEECLRYAMSLPVSVTITGCDSMGVLEQALALAIGWKPLPETEKVALLRRTAAAAAQGAFERFKTSEQFDGTTRNPKWLDSAEV